MAVEIENQTRGASTIEQLRLLDRWLDRVFDAEDPDEERAAVLAEIDALAPSLKERFLAMVAADDASVMSWEQGQLQLFSGDEISIEEELDLGAWVVERELGRGGMGRVYLVHREHQGPQGSFEQYGALKLMTRTLRQRDVLPGVAASHEHFLREMSTLAMLAEHPHIARFLDAGVTEGAAHVPFFVMEYIDGDAVDAYCQHRSLDLRARVLLVIDLLRAVHFMHQRGVIHRDLKPANILVTSQGHPKILDLGIAQTSHVEGSRAFTPGWSAPEQRDGSVVTAAADLYNLGLLLQLLCEDLESPVEIEAIVSRATQEQPRDRYASAEAFARDLEKLLDGEVVDALEHDRVYVLRHTLRRYRGVLAAAAVIASVVVLAGALLVRQNIATEAAKEDAIAAREVAEREAATSREIAGFMEDVLTSANPLESGEGADVTIEQVLDQSASLMQKGDRVSSPVVQRTMLRVMADAYLGLGLAQKAQPLVERAKQLPDALASSDDGRFPCTGHGERLESARLAFSEAGVLRGLTRYEDAIARFKSLVEQCEEQDGVSDIAARAHNQIADMYFWNLRQENRAYEHYAAAFERSGDGNDAERSTRIFAMTGLALVAAERGEPEEERRDLIAKIFALADEVWGPEHTSRAKLYNQLSYAEVDLDAKIERRHQALDVYKRIYGEDHIYVASVLNDLALTFEDTEPALAMQHIERAHAIVSEKLPEQNKLRISITRNFGAMLRHKGHLERAEPLLEWCKVHDPDSIFSFSNLALLRHQQGRVKEALELNKQGISRLSTEANELTINYRYGFQMRIAAQHEELDEFEDAADYYQRAITSALSMQKGGDERKQAAVFALADVRVAMALRGAR